MNKGTVNGLITKRDLDLSLTRGNDVFVHYSGLNMEGFKSLEEGQEVEFEVIQGAQGISN